MAKYTLEIKIPDAGNKIILCEILLEGSQEAYPDDYFRIQANRDKLKEDIQNKSSRKIEPLQLNQVINSWIKEIGLGRAQTTIEVDLKIPLVKNSSLSEQNQFYKPLKKDSNSCENTPHKEKVEEQKLEYEFSTEIDMNRTDDL